MESELIGADTDNLLNLRYVRLGDSHPAEKNHLELRVWDGVLPYGVLWVVQAHVAISVALVAAAAAEMVPL